MTYEQEFELLAELFTVALKIDSRMDEDKEEVKFCYRPGAGPAEEPRKIDTSPTEKPGETSMLRYSDTSAQSSMDRALRSKYGVGAEQKPAVKRVVPSSTSAGRKESTRPAHKPIAMEDTAVPAYELRYKDTPKISFPDEKRPTRPNVAKAVKPSAPVKRNTSSKQSASVNNTVPRESKQPQSVQPKPRAHQSVVSFPSMKRKSFATHVATGGVWGRIASYGGINGPLIHINAGHGR